MRPDYTHERGVEKAYRGRQLLELLQNADDAGKDHSRPARFLFRLTGDYLVAANDGVPFSDDGIESLVISDRSPKQLERGRYIGQKGLGFRSLLSWSERPLVRSGGRLVAFDPEHARRVAAEIADQVPELAAETRQYEASHGSVPVPVMRFPFVPDSGDARAVLAEQVHAEGFETVIVLPLPSGSKRQAVVEDIVRQAAGIGAATLLFSNHLNEVRVAVAGTIETWSVERQPSATNQTVVLQRGTSVSLWTIYRREVMVPKELLEEEAPTAAGLAVAVPEDAGNTQGNTLCVFFPTSVALPTSVLAHATLETDDSRKRLIEGPATRFVLRQLADFLAEVCENQVAASHRAWRGLELVTGAERCDPELTNLGFKDAFRECLRARRLFPRVDGSIETASSVWVSPGQAWSETAHAGWLGDLLSTPPTKEIDTLIQDLDLRVLPLDERVRRLEEHVAASIATGRIQEVGTLVGRLLEAKALPKNPRAKILIDNTGTQLDTSEHVLLPPEGLAVRRPGWATDLHFLHADYANAIRTIAQLTARELSRRLSDVGYVVEEYQLEAVARRLVRSAERWSAGSAKEEINRHLDVLGCVFDMARLQDSSASISAPLRVLTERGTLRRADECYVGAAYPSGTLLAALYGPLGEDEFCAGPEVLRTTAPAAEIEKFLVRIGVANRVRQKPLDSPCVVREAGLQEHLRETLARVTYPHELAEHRFESAEEAFAGLYIDYGDHTIPDRWAKVLEKGSPEAIIAFVAADCRQHLDAQRPTGIVLRARYGLQYNRRDLRTVNVTDPTLYLLREVPWVPADDGKRHQPRRIAISKNVRRMLGEAFRASAVDDTSPLLASTGGPAAVQMVLAATGAIESLEALQGDELYSLLLELPERDPEGQVAKSVYRSLLEAGQLDIESPRREEFLRRGQMWGTLGDAEAYYEVDRLRYNPRTSVPEPIRQHVPLVAIDPRRSATEVARVFGVAPLSPDEYEIEVDGHATKRTAWSANAAGYLRAAVPYLYALRLSQRADDRGEEKRAFADMDLVVASQLVATVRLRNREPEAVTIDQDLKGLVSDRRLYIVSEPLALEADPVFWRAVADLVADAINVSRVGGDFGSLLTCADDRPRLRLLNHLTGGHAEECLKQAREALQIEESDEEDVKPVPPPRTSIEPEPLSRSPGAAPAPAPAVPPSFSTSGEPTAPTPISPPAPSTGSTRNLVVASSARSGGRDGSTASGPSEDETLYVAERFEALATPPRYTLRVSHLRGTDAFGCDILSFAEQEVRDRTRDEQVVSEHVVARFIEVKGRSSRTAPVELTENERRAAARHGPKYYLYRVFTDVSRTGYHEIAILPDPVNSPGQRTQTQYWYDLASGSGAEWYQIPFGTIAAAEPVSPPDPEPTSDS